MTRNFKYLSFLLVISLNEINIFIKKIFFSFPKIYWTIDYQTLKLRNFIKARLVFLNQIQKPEKPIMFHPMSILQL